MENYFISKDVQSCIAFGIIANYTRNIQKYILSVCKRCLMECEDKCMRGIENDTEGHYSALPSVQFSFVTLEMAFEIIMQFMWSKGIVTIGCCTLV